MHRRLAIAVFVALGLPAADAHAQARCVAPKTPVLTMTTRAASPRVDFTRSVADLTRQHPATVAGTTHTLGLATVGFGHQMEVTYRTQRARGGKTCVTITEARVELTLVDPVVYVARELPRDSCIHREVLTHEYTHVRIDRKILDRESKQVRDVLARTIAEDGAALGASAEDGMRRIRAKLQSVMTREIAALQRRRNAAQAKLDTPKEYLRISESCDGEVRRYIAVATPRSSRR